MSDPKETIKSTVRQRVEARMRDCIRTGLWCPGMMLPSRRELAKEFDIDLNTLQRAIAPLLADGLLRADAGRATFVAERPIRTVADDLPQAAATVRQPLAPHAGSRIGIVTGLYIRYTQYSDADYIYMTVSAIERYFAAHGISTIVADVTKLGHRISTADAMRSLAEYDVHGLIVTSACDDDAIAYMESLPIPVVFMGAESMARRIPYIYYSNREAAMDATRHLIEKGCRDLRFFAPARSQWAEERLAGMTLEVKRHPDLGIRQTTTFGQFRQPMHDFDQREAGRLAAGALIDAGETFDGILAANDLYASGFIDAAAERGLSSKRDFMVVGFDDSTRLAAVGEITSMRPPVEQMAMEASLLLSRGLAGDDIRRHIALFSDLIPRSSTYRATESDDLNLTVSQRSKRR
jgi:LacI family transcriptional regulator